MFRFLEGDLGVVEEVLYIVVNIRFYGFSCALCALEWGLGGGEVGFWTCMV